MPMVLMVLQGTRMRADEAFARQLAEEFDAVSVEEKRAREVRIRGGIAES